MNEVLGDYHIKYLMSQNHLSKTFLVEKGANLYQLKAYRKDKIIDEIVLQQILHERTVL